MRLPIVQAAVLEQRQLIRQTDIVMLLTPRIVRTHELRASDLSPIYIGTQSNMALTGPPVPIGGAPEPEPASAAAAAPATPPSVRRPASSRPPSRYSRRARDRSR